MSLLAFEIGCEEIPARYVEPLRAALEETAAALLAEARIDYGRLETHATPRRLILLAHNVADRQRPLTEHVRGPSASIAFDAGGRPTKAAEGFARGQGVSVDALLVKETEQGPYVFAERVDPGEATPDVLPGLLRSLLLQMPLPRSMRWGDGDFAFVRPIRWLLALWDEQVVPLALDDVVSDRMTRGHRTLAPGPHAVAHAGELLDVLRRAYVLADVAARRSAIERGVREAAAALGGVPVYDDAFLDEVNNLVEWPTPFAGSFDAAYLALPDDLLVTTMQSHQRYFAVRGHDGRLLPHFVAVRNGDDVGLDTVRAGNEKVLRARLADAKFFFEEDLKQPLEQYVPALRRVTFLNGLGSLYDKTERLQRLTAWLAQQLGYGEQDAAATQRAALLAKADQVTHLVYEWPELEGIMGREYALAGGEAPEVAQALAEQYLPRPGSDALPETKAGVALALADRLDTLAGSFLVGLEPTGSQDPYALRRQAFTLLQLAREHAPELDLVAAFKTALAGYAEHPATQEAAAAADHDATLARLEAFCVARLTGQLREAGYRPELVDAVLNAGWQPLGAVWRRAAAAHALTAAPYFDDLLTAYRRAQNLTRDVAAGAPDPALFQEAAERDLYEHLQRVQAASAPALATGDYAAFFAACASLRAPVDRMLDEVLIMAEDPQVRANRLALLRRIVDWIGQVLDVAALGQATS